MARGKVLASFPGSPPIISSRQRAPQMGTSIGRTVLIHAPIFSPHHAKGEDRRRPFLIGLETQAALGQYSLPPIVRLMSFPLSTSGPAARFMGSSKWGPSASGRAFPPKKIIRCGLVSIHRRRLIIPPLFCLKMFVRSWWGTLPARNKCVAGRGAVTHVNE